MFDARRGSDVSNLSDLRRSSDTSMQSQMAMSCTSLESSLYEDEWVVIGQIFLSNYWLEVSDWLSLPIGSVVDIDAQFFPAYLWFSVADSAFHLSYAVGDTNILLPKCFS